MSNGEYQHYLPAQSLEFYVLKSIAIEQGNKKMMDVIESLEGKYRDLKRVSKNAVHSHAFGTTFDFESAQNAIEV